MNADTSGKSLARIHIGGLVEVDGMRSGGKFSESEIAAFLRQVDAGRPIADICREAGIGLTTFYKWRKKISGPKALEVKQMRQLEEENQRLKKLVAELSLDKEMLQDALRRKT